MKPSNEQERRINKHIQQSHEPFPALLLNLSSLPLNVLVTGAENPSFQVLNKPKSEIRIAI
jgi:hypothetical protein